MSSDSPDGKQGVKRKRSSGDAAARHDSEDSYTDDNAAHRSRNPALNQSSNQPKGVAAASQDVKKRTKTQRACDKCRTKKIRCALKSRVFTLANQYAFYLSITQM
jgi:hypothetical protein